MANRNSFRASNPRLATRPFQNLPLWCSFARPTTNFPVSGHDGLKFIHSFKFLISNFYSNSSTFSSTLIALITLWCEWLKMIMNKKWKKNLPNVMSMAEIKGGNNLPEEAPGFLWRKATLFHQIIEQFAAANMFQNQISSKWFSFSFFFLLFYFFFSRNLTDIFCFRKRRINAKHADVRLIS